MTISIPISSDKDLLIKTGEKVDFNTSLMKAQLKDQITIPLSQILRIPESKIFDYLKKLVGDTIQKGDLLAEKKSFLSSKKYHSEIDGIIKEINHQEGCIVVETNSADETRTKSHFNGEVVKIDHDELELKVHNFKKYELKYVTEDFGGELYHLTSIEADITEDKISDRVIVADSIAAYDQVKLETLGARGFLTLQPLVEDTALPVARLKQIADLEKINQLKFPYCTICKKNTTIYFYE